MAVVSISRQTFLGGQELGRHLADKLGYTYFTREELSDQAEALGVNVQRLRDAVTRPPGVRQELRRERDRYVACITMLLCEKILSEDIIYNGHAGHMLLLGIPNILRISVVADLEFRINFVHHELGYSRREAKEYIKGIDVVRDRWVRYLYKVDWHNPFHYDLTVHLSQTGFEHAAEALVTMARLPEFQLNRYSVQAIRDRLLASRVHFRLASHDLTRHAEYHVTANRGMVQVTAEPRYADSIAHAREVLNDIDDIREVTTCTAMDSILYVAEQFDSDSDTFNTIMDLAQKWNSAIELVSLPAVATQETLDDGDIAAGKNPKIPTGNIPPPPLGMRDCHEELKQFDCCGGCQALYGTPYALVPALQRRTDCRLLVMGELFLERSPETRTRLRTDLKNQLSDNLTFPVVEEAELSERFRFRPIHAARMVLWLALAAGLLAVTFVFHDQLLAFLASELDRPVRFLSILGVVVFAPLFAYAYGSFTRFVLKLIGLE